jgi:pyruvate dehydrogenase E2 component (dihydrolipoamide acetyltransferase)
MAVDVFMPKMSDHMETGEIVSWLVGEGERVEEGQPLLEVMTDKATAELDAPASGILTGIRAAEGTEIPVGETIAFIAEPGEEIEILPVIDGGRSGRTKGESRVQDAASPESGPVDVTPVARRLAELHGIPLDRVAGTGVEGRILKEDVLSMRGGETPSPEVKASPAARRRARELGVTLENIPGTGPGGLIRENDVDVYHGSREVEGAKTAAGQAAASDWLDLTGIERRTGERMVVSATTVPQFSISLRADAEKLLWIKDMLEGRIEQATGRRLSLTALLAKILAAVLKNHPRLNSTYLDGRLKLFRDVNVGVAVGSPDGLIVPVVHRADARSLAQVNGDLRLFQEKAKNMRFTSEELSGGTFTLSNLGMYGVEWFQALVNPPQSAILAVGSVMDTPIGGSGGGTVLRPLIGLTLTVDHRSVDGLQAARFLGDVRETIENPGILISGG